MYAILPDLLELVHYTLMCNTKVIGSRLQLPDASTANCTTRNKTQQKQCYDILNKTLHMFTV